MARHPIPLLTVEANLKRAVRRHLKALGFVTRDGALVHGELTKDDIRSLHRAHRQEKLKASRRIRDAAEDLAVHLRVVKMWCRAESPLYWRGLTGEHGSRISLRWRRCGGVFRHLRDTDDGFDFSFGTRTMDVYWAYWLWVILCLTCVSGTNTLAGVARTEGSAYPVPWMRTYSVHFHRTT